MFKILYRKELTQIFNSPFGYIVTVLFALFANFMFMKDVFVTQSASLRPFFATASWIVLVFSSAVSMGVFAQERRTNTIETLLTLPISERTIAFAKFASTMTVIAIGLALTFAFPITMAVVSEVFVGYLTQVFVGYLGLLMLAALFVSIGMLASLLSRSQVVAFLLSSVFTFFLFSFSSDFASPFVPRFISDPLLSFSPSFHFDTFVKGVIDMRSLWYFVGAVGIVQFVIISLLRRRN